MHFLFLPMIHFIIYDIFVRYVSLPFLSLFFSYLCDSSLFFWIKVGEKPTCFIETKMVLQERYQTCNTYIKHIVYQPRDLNL